MTTKANNQPKTRKSSNSRRVFINAPLYYMDPYFGSSRSRTSEGYLKGIAGLIKTGVLEFSAEEMGVEGDGIVRVLFPEDSVFSPMTMDSAEMKPITLGHPEEFVDPDNYNDVSVGHLGNDVYPFDDALTSSILITKQAAIDAVDGGIEETSIGYHINVSEESGMFDGISYDYRVNGPIEINHLAIVDRGRAGSSIRVYNEKGTEMTEEQLKNFKDALTEGLNAYKEEFSTSLTNAVKEMNAKNDGDPSGEGDSDYQKELDTLKKKHGLDDSVPQVNVNLDTDKLFEQIGKIAAEVMKEAAEAQASAGEGSGSGDGEGEGEGSGDGEGEGEGAQAKSGEKVGATNAMEFFKERMALINKVTPLVNEPEKLIDMETDDEIIAAAFENEDIQDKSKDYLMASIDIRLANRDASKEQRKNIRNVQRAPSKSAISSGTRNFWDLKLANQTAKAGR